MKDKGDVAISSLDRLSQLVYVPYEFTLQLTSVGLNLFIVVSTPGQVGSRHIIFLPRGASSDVS